jgi:translation initiation factor 3 subunit B
VEKFKQFLWRPRPATLLSKEEQKQIRRNLREYSKDFEEEDRLADDKEKGAVVEQRRSMLSEWLAWLEREQEELRADRLDAGLPEYPEEEEEEAGDEETEEVKEIVEEIVEETEEIIG